MASIPSQAMSPWKMSIRTVAFPMDSTNATAVFTTLPEDDFQVDGGASALDIIINYRPTIRSVITIGGLCTIKLSVEEKDTPDSSTYSPLGAIAGTFVTLKDDSAPTADVLTERLSISADSDHPPSGMPIRLKFERQTDGTSPVPGTLTILSVWVRTRGSACC